MSKNFCMTLNYEQILVLASVGTRCISVSAFAYLVGTPVGDTSSAAGLNICEITARIKEYKSMIQENETKQDILVLLEKAKLHSREVLISKP